LFDAITDANNNGVADVITLTGTGITLDQDLPLIFGTLSIVGPGSGAFTLDASGFETFTSAGSATNTDFSLSGITVENADVFAVNTDGMAVELSDIVVDSLIVHVDGDFAATDVEVSGAPAVGMDLDVGASDLVELTRVTVSGSDGTGIELLAGDDSVVTLVDVTASGNGVSSGDGLNAELSGNSSMTVENSSFVNNEIEGMEVDLLDDSSLMVTDSDFSDNDSDGVIIESEDASTTTLDGVTADGNNNDGIDVDGNDDAVVTIRNSSADDNGGNGFESDFDGGTGIFENLTAERNDDDGFDMEADDGSAGGSTLTLTNVVALDNGENGINAEPDTDDSSVIINGGRAEGNGEYGLYMNVDQGTVIVTDFVSRDNPGGGVDIDGYNGQATLRDSTVTGNGSTSLFGAGGIEIDADADDGFSDPLDILIENTTISDNIGGIGGGIGGINTQVSEGGVREGSTLTVRNSTISGNTAFSGGAIQLEGDIDSQVTIEHSTVTLNDDESAGASASFSDLNLTVDHSIIAGNSTTGTVDDLQAGLGATPAINFSLVQTAGAASLAALSAGTGNVVGQPAGLGPLADNGGPTLTHLPSDSSAALNAGDAGITGAPATDQRGEDRIVGPIDIGAVEVQAAQLAATGPAESALAVGGAAALLLLLGGVLVAARTHRREATARP